MAINKKSTKSRILGLASSRRRLNSSKTIDEVTYYSLADVESVVAAVLSEVSSDPTVGITLESADTGITLNCVTENGDEYAVDVDLDSEDAAVAGEDIPAGDVNASRRRMNSSRRKRLNSSTDKAMYAKYYDKVSTIEEAARRLSADDGMTDADTIDTLTDMVAETEVNYGDVVGFLVPKPKYFDVLDENNLSILFVLADGGIGRQFGRRFYSVDEELAELIDMKLLNSSRRN